MSEVVGDKHIIRIYIMIGGVDLRAECHSSDTAACEIEGGDGNGSTVCRYVQWWKETEVPLEEFYAGHEELLHDNAEITIDWDGNGWVWELKKNDYKND